MKIIICIVTIVVGTVTNYHIVQFVADTVPTNQIVHVGGTVTIFYFAQNVAGILIPVNKRTLL